MLFSPSGSFLELGSLLFSVNVAFCSAVCIWSSVVCIRSSERSCSLKLVPSDVWVSPQPSVMLVWWLRVGVESLFAREGLIMFLKRFGFMIVSKSYFFNSLPTSSEVSGTSLRFSIDADAMHTALEVDGCSLMTLSLESFNQAKSWVQLVIPSLSAHVFRSRSNSSSEASPVTSWSLKFFFKKNWLWIGLKIK